MTEVIRRRPEREAIEPTDPREYQRADGSPLIHRPGVDYSHFTEEAANSGVTALEDMLRVSSEPSSELGSPIDMSSPTEDHDPIANFRARREEKDQRWAAGIPVEAGSRAAKRHERVERLKQTPAVLRSAGRSALRVLRRSGSAVFEGSIAVAAATSVVASEANAGLKRMDNFVDTKTREAQTFARDKAVELGQAGVNKAEAISSKVGNAVENGIESAIAGASSLAAAGREKVADVKETTRDVIDAYKGRFLRFREKALNRKMVRRAKWMNFRSETVAKYNDAKDNTYEKIEDAKWSAKATRTAGRVAIGSFSDTRTALKSR